MGEKRGNDDPERYAEDEVEEASLSESREERDASRDEVEKEEESGGALGGRNEDRES